MITIPVRYIDTTKYKIALYNDDYAESPTDWGNFTIVQFCDNDFGSYQDRYANEFVTEGGKLTPAVQAKLRAGKMFTISYSRYSNADGGYYRLDGSITDTIEGVDGFIIFDDGYIKNVSYADRRKYAEQDLRTYTHWAQGDVYWLKIETASGLEVDEIGGGLYGLADVKSAITDIIGDAEYDIVGIDYDGNVYEVTSDLQYNGGN